MTSTKKPIITLIAGMSANHVIGNDNALPWSQSDDLKRFKALTMGKPVIMGRKTFDSIGRPLPQRQNIVISTNPNLIIDGVDVVNSINDALNKCTDAPEVMVIGGETIYNQTIDIADKLELTLIHTHVVGDASFPDFIQHGQWVCTLMEYHEPSPRNEHPMSFMRFERIQKG